MGGFYGQCGVLNSSQEFNWNIPESYKQKGSIEIPHLQIFHFSNSKFDDDKILNQSVNEVYGIDGVILNKAKLLKKNAGTSWEQLFGARASSNLTSFLNELRGEFSGIYYDISKKQLELFVSQNGTKPFYYLIIDQNLIFSSDYYQLVTLAKSQTTLTYDSSAISEFLELSFFKENRTHFVEIKTLKGGEKLIYNGEVRVEKFWDWNTPDYNNNSLIKNTKIIHELFELAILEEYEKDGEYNYGHICTLSGGLDSRMNVLYADKLNFKDKIHLCTSQSNYLDYQIASKIATDLNEQLIFHPLDRLTHLKNIEANIEINGALVGYNGSAHMLELFSNYLPENTGIIHSGQLGDGLLNSFVPKDSQIHKDKSVYKNSEIELIYNKTFNSVNNGSRTSEPFSYLISPFTYFDVMEFILTVPPEQRKNGRLYFSWIKTFMPDSAKYDWEKINLKPSHFNHELGLFLNKFRLGLKNRLFGHDLGRSMNPYKYWFKTDPTLGSMYTSIFENNISFFDNNLDLRNIISAKFKSRSISEQTNAVTLLKFVELIS